MKETFVVHTNGSAPKTWVFTSREKAETLLQAINKSAPYRGATLSVATTNPSMSSHLRAAVELSWNGEIVTVYGPSIKPTEPAEQTLSAHSFHTPRRTKTWVTYRGHAKTKSEARRNATAMVEDLKRMRLWPENEETAKGLRTDSIWNLPIWLTKVPLTAETAEPEPDGALNGMVICHHCNAVMRLTDGEQGRVYRCPGAILNPEAGCPNPELKQSTPEGPAIYHIAERESRRIGPEQAARKAERTERPEDQQAMNSKLAADIIESIEGMIAIAEKHNVTTMLEQLRTESNDLSPALNQAFQDGSSPIQAILNTAFSDEENANLRPVLHTAAALRMNLTAKNRRTIQRHLICVNPTPKAETLVWRKTPGDIRPMVQMIDIQTIMKKGTDF